jgi:hypothetical protein
VSCESQGHNARNTRKFDRCTDHGSKISGYADVGSAAEAQPAHRPRLEPQPETAQGGISDLPGNLPMMDLSRTVQQGWNFSCI